MTERRVETHHGLVGLVGEINAQEIPKENMVGRKTDRKRFSEGHHVRYKDCTLLAATASAVQERVLALLELRELALVR